MLKNLQVLLLKVESTYNTDSTPTGGTNAVLVENLSWSFANSRMAERMPIRSSLAPVKPIYAGTLVTIKFDAEIKGSGTAGTAPEIGPALTCCGMSETVVAVTSVTYKPSSTVSTHKSATIYLYQDGTVIKVTGCRGKVSGSHEVGSFGKLSFEFTGHFVSRTDASIATPTYSSQVPVPLINVPFSIDSYSAVVRKISWDLGNEIATPGSLSASDGYGEVRIAKRKLTGSFDPEAVLAATYNFVTKWTSGAAMALDTGLVGSVAGNRWKLTAPAVTYTEIGNGDTDGILTHDVKFIGAESTSDDDCSLAFT